MSWDDPGVLQHVGLGLDRFGEVDPITEPGEYDQEQHDAVRDVFVLPSACLLVRADLFRALGGFDPAISFHGDDVDLCWRVHLSGARVVVAPQARVRHREELEVRRPDLHHDLLRARHRMRSVATLTGGRRLPLRSLEMAVLTVVELVVGLFTGRFGEAWASLRAFVGLLPRTPTLLARRRHDRQAPARRRRRDPRPAEPRQRPPRRRTGGPGTPRRTSAPTPTSGAGGRARSARPSPGSWSSVGIIVASRTMIDTSVPSVGELLPLPDSPRDWWSDFVVRLEPGRARRHRRQPDRLGRAVDRPACCGCSGWASG